MTQSLFCKQPGFGFSSMMMQEYAKMNNTIFTTVQRSPILFVTWSPTCNLKPGHRRSLFHPLPLSSAFSLHKRFFCNTPSKHSLFERDQYGLNHLYS